MRDNDSKRSRGFGYVTYASEKDAYHAANALDQTT